MKQTLLILFLCCWGGVLLKGQSITSVVPSQNPVRGGEVLTVNISGSGTNFSAGSANYIAAIFGSTSVHGIVDLNTVTNTNMDVTFYVPCGVCGNADLSVTTPANGQMTYANAFSVSCGQITSVNPNVGTVGQNLTVGISGTNMNFGQGSNAAWVYFYDPATGNYLFPSTNPGGTSNSITVDVNIPQGTCNGSYDVIVYPGSNSCAITMPNAFDVIGNTGQITMVNPDTITPGQTLPITISGTGVNFQQGSLLVYFRKSNGQRFYATASNVSANSVTVNYTTPNYMCGGSYDVCVEQTPNTCPVCFEDGLYVNAQNAPAVITNVTSSPSPAQGGQSLVLNISGTGIDFTQGSSMYFMLRNTVTGAGVGSSFSAPISTNEVMAYFNSMPYDCGNYDLEVYVPNTCSNNILTYNNAVTVSSTLNPVLYSVYPYPSPTAGQLRLRLSGANIDFTQGSSMLSVRLVSPTTGTVLTGSNIIPSNFSNSIATVDFTPSVNDCGYYNLEVMNVPVGCGGTTTVGYHRLVGVNIRHCASNAPSSLTTHSGGNNNSIVSKVNDGLDGLEGENDLQILDATDVGSNGLLVQVFPNPMDEETTILVEAEEQKVLNFALYDVLGQQVKQVEFNSNERLQVNRENLPAGMYIYRILDATGNPLHVGKLEMK